MYGKCMFIMVNCVNQALIWPRVQMLLNGPHLDESSGFPLSSQLYLALLPKGFCQCNCTASLREQTYPTAPLPFPFRMQANSMCTAAAPSATRSLRRRQVHHQIEQEKHMAGVWHNVLFSLDFASALLFGSSHARLHDMADTSVL